MDTQTSENGSRLHVLLVAEGTYPFYWGGVSTWAHMLLSDLHQVDFTVMSLVGDPDTPLQFTLPANVVDFRVIPLWGIHDAKEMRSDFGLTRTVHQGNTTETVVRSEFIPLLRLFLHTLFADAAATARPRRLDATQSRHPITDDVDGLFWIGNGSFRLEGLAHVIHDMYRFFLSHDFDATMRSRAVWECFVQVAQDLFPSLAASCGYPRAGFSLADLTSGLNWLYHWLFPLAAPLPRADVTNAAMAGICTLVAVVEKLEYGAGYLLTEHGVYLRERYLAEAAESKSLFLKLLNLRFALRMTQLSYAMADQISPCCDYNQHWEKRNGADPSKLVTIYYGVDSTRFAPEPRGDDGPPVVVWVGRIDPLKDLLTLLEAAAVVRRERPDIRFLFYGSATPGNEAYYQQCLNLRAELDLQETVAFAGYTADTASAFNGGDLSVLSSISEGFPYAILEAMMCGRPVVATAVGGIPEQVDGCGITVEPRNAQELARGILALINNPDLRASLGQAARQKATHMYSTAHAHSAYYASYLRLAGMQVASPSPADGEGEQSLEADHVPMGVRLLDSQPDNGHERVPTQAGLAEAKAQPVGRGASVSPDKAAIAELAIEVARRDSMPVDALEVTALIESLGITDAVARQRYGVDDVFKLGKLVLKQMKASALTSHVRLRKPDKPQTLADVMADYLRGPIVAAPSLIMLLIIVAFAGIGHVDATRILALSLGFTGGMLISSGFVHAIGRRVSIYLGMEKVESAWRFVSLSIRAGILCAGIVTLLAFLVSTRLGVPEDLALIFVLSLAAVSVLWLLAAGLFLRQYSQWLAVGLLGGLITGIGIHQALVPIGAVRLPIATGAGFLVTVAVVWRALLLCYGQDIKNSRRTAPPWLPSAAYLVREAMPYFTYGLLCMVFLLTPHAVGWAGRVDTDQSLLWAGVSVEVGMTLALIPLMLIGGVAERALHLFWQRLRLAQMSVSGAGRERFSKELEQVYREHLVRYLAALGLACLASYALVQMAAQSGFLSQWLQLGNLDRLIFVFRLSLVACWLMGWAMFNCIYVVTLARPRWAVLAIGVGIIVLIIVGVPLSLTINFSLAAVAFMAGGVAFVVVSSWGVRHVLQSADYYIYALL